MATSKNRRGGVFYLTIDGVGYELKGTWTYNLGTEERTDVVGVSRTHGYSAKPQPPMLEGAITDAGDLDVKQLTLIDGATGLLELYNGKRVVFSNLWFSGKGTISTEEGEIEAKFTARHAEELLAA